MNIFINLLTICIAIVFYGCSEKKPALSKDRQAVNGLVTKATVILSDDGSDENNILIRNGVADRLYRNSIFKKEKSDALSIEIFVRPTFQNHGVYPIVAEWKNAEGNICLTAKYPVSYNRCYGGRSLCVYIAEADELSEDSSGCSRYDIQLALADASILHNPHADAFDAIDTYKDEAFDKLSK